MEWQPSSDEPTEQDSEARQSRRSRWRLFALGAVCALFIACGGDDDSAGEGAPGARGSGGGRPGGAGGWGGRGGAPARAAVPVEVEPTTRRDLSSFIETNGVLEAEREVDLVARSAGPITELLAEENQFVRRGQLLARLDQKPARATLELSQVEFSETQLSFERVQALHEENLISRDEFEQSRARMESAKARLAGDQLQLDHTEVRSPFDGLIVRRYVKFAESVAANQALFRLSDFTPLLCVIQVPERSLALLASGQTARLTVEGFPGEQFSARVLRISPVVEAATGTVRVTLEVGAQEKLRPGMFASVFLETDKREGALVVPRTSLTLDSVGDSVYVVEGDVAKRRSLQLGVRDGDYVEVLSGVEEGEQVVSIGQDGLADGTPVQVLGLGDDKGAADARGGEALAQARADGSDSQAGRNQESARAGSERGGERSAGAPPGGPPGGMDPQSITPEMLERIKERMRARGLSEEQIEARLAEMREKAKGGN